MVNYITNYLQSDVVSPFFLIVGDNEYINIKEQLSAFFQEHEIVGISNYCTSPDRIPNTDVLFDDLKNGKIKVLIGLGEYLALNGDAVAFDILSKLQDLNLNGNKAILVLRCVANTVKKLQFHDLRFDGRRVVYAADCKTNLSLTFVPASFELPSVYDGLKATLAAFENGNATNIIAKTKMKFPNSLIEIHSINTAYDGVKYLLPTFVIPNTIEITILSTPL